MSVFFLLELNSKWISINFIKSFFFFFKTYMDFLPLGTRKKKKKRVPDSCQGWNVEDKVTSNIRWQGLSSRFFFTTRGVLPSFIRRFDTHLDTGAPDMIQQWHITNTGGLDVIQCSLIQFSTFVSWSHSFSVVNQNELLLWKWQYLGFAGLLLSKSDILSERPGNFCDFVPLWGKNLRQMSFWKYSGGSDEDDWLHCH